MALIFTIIGDANVSRNMTALNMASRDVIKNAQLLDGSALATFDNALNDVRPESNVLIIASITEYLLCGGFTGTVSSTIEPVLSSFKTKVFGFCAFRPTLQV